MNKKTKAYCNKCLGERNHEVLFTETMSWVDDYAGFGGQAVAFDAVATLGIMLTGNFALKGIIDWIYKLNGVTDPDSQGWILKEFST